MAKAARVVTTALAVSAALLMARAATAADSKERATIVLHVDDFANLLSGDLGTAEMVVRRTFAAAGVRIIWRQGRDKTPPIDGALYLTVLVLSRQMGEKKIAADGVGPNVLGQAAKECGRAYIFSHRIVPLAARNGRDLGSVLGRVLAHEIGHLVLPEYGHSETGLMTAGLDLRPNADAAFTLEQTAAIRGRLTNQGTVTASSAP
jgi:hypothetical protein